MTGRTELSAALNASGAAIAVLDVTSAVTFASAAFRERPGLMQALAQHEGVRGRIERGGHIILGQAGLRQVCRFTPLPGGGAVVTALGAALHAMTGREAIRLIADYWRLTPAEADAAWRHAQGGALADIAAAREVSIETVRSQMRSVRQKAGVGDGRELQALIWSVLAAPTAPSSVKTTMSLA